MIKEADVHLVERAVLGTSRRAILSGRWASAESAALSTLWSDGVAVPYPVQATGTELLLEFLGTDDGTAAPRLLTPPGPRRAV